jgi:hypothetical protein
MSTFQFDTSGVVLMPIRVNGKPWTAPQSFDSLPRFAQGYIKAMALVGVPRRIIGLGDFKAKVQFRFSDLAPETLARIADDCGRFVACGHKPFDPDRDDFDQGRDFWAERQRNGHHAEFPRLIPYLGDDGKVYLREVGQ